MSTQLSIGPGEPYPTNVIDYGQYQNDNYWQPITPFWPSSHVCPTTHITYVAQSRCAWCQGEHIGGCDRLKSVTYRRDGTVERVEFFGKDDS